MVDYEPEPKNQSSIQSGVEIWKARLEEVTAKDAKLRELWDKKAKGRFNGEIDWTTGAYRRLDETFPEDDIARWTAMLDADPNIVEHMLKAYDDGAWSTVSGLQKWLREDWRKRHSLKPVTPTVGIAFRACVAQRPALLKIPIQRLGESTHAKCWECGKPMVPICDTCIAELVEAEIVAEIVEEGDSKDVRQ